MPAATIVIGVDFGTTFSGISWAITKRPKEIFVVTDWDSQYNTCSDRGKCPTQLEYGNIGHQTPWGYTIPPEKDVLRWFKLLLLKEEDLPKSVVDSPHFQQAVSQLKKLKVSAVDLVACFLKSLWAHCMENITRALGPGEVSKCKIHFVMTMPAIWPHYVQDRMRHAADIAGMLIERDSKPALSKSTLQFLSEPEAAAMAALSDMKPKPEVNEDDTIIVCDAGGGTAASIQDLISYQVDNANHFVLKECVSGEGGLCGGVFVDQNFEDLIASKIGRSSWSKVHSEDKRRFMTVCWENGIKSQFSGNDRVFHVEVPDGDLPDGTLGKRKRLQTISLGRSELLKVFSPVEEICRLVQRQKSAIAEKGLPSPKYIILVGGFGCCQYLYNKLTDAHAESGCTILRPPADKPWTAVSRGAVRHAILHKTVGKNKPRSIVLRAPAPGNFLVQSRICRMGYGIMFSATWNAQLHSGQPKHWDIFDEQYLAYNQMEWVTLWKPPRTGRITITKPIMLGAWTKDVRKLCSIKWNQKVDLTTLPLQYNASGLAFYRVKYEVRVNVNGPELNIEVYHEGRKVAEGDVAVNYN
ncbi:hypothetical protein PWT90_02718 [Aphanocladium album]|nr:hypothetical protein PWT90_02718 [Aphanocladium album]